MLFVVSGVFNLFQEKFNDLLVYEVAIVHFLIEVCLVICSEY